jgi:hypothetical protein
MYALSASALLGIWENGAGKAPVEQALAILRAAFPYATHTKLMKLTIGQRDTCLIQLYELTFGSHLKGLANCPACSERLELDFNGRDLLAPSSPLLDPELMEPLNAESSFRLNDYEVTYRLPTSADLLSSFEPANISTLREQLLQACVVSVICDGKTKAANELPESVFEELAQHMDKADPMANLILAAACPACGHTWQIIFDIVSYFWNEINAWAIRLLHEVHLLASAYGWSEADILNMSAWRRQRYLELIG